MPSGIRAIDDQLREAILASPLSKYMIGKSAGVAPNVVDRFVRGERDLRLATAAKISGVLNLELQRPMPEGGQMIVPAARVSREVLIDADAIQVVTAEFELIRQLYGQHSLAGQRESGGSSVRVVSIIAERDDRETIDALETLTRETKGEHCFPPRKVRVRIHERLNSPMSEFRATPFGWRPDLSWAPELSYANGSMTAIDTNGSPKFTIVASGLWGHELDSNTVVEIPLDKLSWRDLETGERRTCQMASRRAEVDGQ